MSFKNCTVQPKTKNSVRTFVFVATTLLFCFSIASADVTLKDDQSTTPVGFQQTDTQELGSCFIGLFGDGVCVQETEQACINAGNLWREGKCPSPIFPTSVGDAS